MLMDREFCQVNHFNHKKFGHDYLVILQWQDHHKRWNVKELCKLCSYQRVTFTDKPIKIVPNVER